MFDYPGSVKIIFFGGGGGGLWRLKCPPLDHLGSRFKISKGMKSS